MAEALSCHVGRHVVSDMLHVHAGSKEMMLQALVARQVRQYQVAEYEKGQRASEYTTWLTSTAHYSAKFEEVSVQCSSIHADRLTTVPSQRKPAHLHGSRVTQAAAGTDCNIQRCAVISWTLLACQKAALHQ